MGRVQSGSSHLRSRCAHPTTVILFVAHRLIGEEHARRQLGVERENHGMNHRKWFEFVGHARKRTRKEEKRGRGTSIINYPGIGRSPVTNSGIDRMPRDVARCKPSLLIHRLQLKFCGSSSTRNCPTNFAEPSSATIATIAKATSCLTATPSGEIKRVNERRLQRYPNGSGCRRRVRKTCFRSTFEYEIRIERAAIAAAEAWRCVTRCFS